MSNVAGSGGWEWPLRFAPVHIFFSAMKRIGGVAPKPRDPARLFNDWPMCASTFLHENPTVPYPQEEEQKSSKIRI